jgi:hypothetical protein
MKPFLHVVDHFYPKPDRIRKQALEMPFTEPKDLVGWRTQACQPAGIRKLIEARFKIKINYWEEDLAAIEACNGVFFSAFVSGRRAETVSIHFDEPHTWMMMLVYLTPNAPCDAGTSLWQHRKTGLAAKPSKNDARKLGRSVEELEALLLRDSERPSRWLEVDRIGNRFNRAVLFPCGLLHSATRHFGSNIANGRLYQSFHFPIVRR